MDTMTKSKGDRMLSIYLRLQNGQIISKKKEAERFQVCTKTIECDIGALNALLRIEYPLHKIEHDKTLGGYYLDGKSSMLTNSEILAVCKILLESRSMPKQDMYLLLDKLVACCVPPNNRKNVGDLIRNERHHYIEPHHGISILNRLWEIGAAVNQQLVLEIDYEKLKGHETVHRVIEPVGIMFSEYYFYLTAFIRDIDRKKEFQNPDDLFPTIYRIDRIKSFQVTNEHFNVQYAERFEEGEFRKRVQFMYGGKLQTVQFRYTGTSIEAVLDRLPTAEVKENPDGSWDVTAEVFGKGIEMWLRSQGDSISSITSSNDKAE